MCGRDDARVQVRQRRRVESGLGDLERRSAGPSGRWPPAPRRRRAGQVRRRARRRAPAACGAARRAWRDRGTVRDGLRLLASVSMSTYCQKSRIGMAPKADQPGPGEVVRCGARGNLYGAYATKSFSPRRNNCLAFGPVRQHAGLLVKRVVTPAGEAREVLAAEMYGGAPGQRVQPVGRRCGIAQAPHHSLPARRSSGFPATWPT